MRTAELISLLFVLGITITVVCTSPVPKTKPAVAKSKQSKESKKECAAMKKLLESDKVIHIKSTDILSGKLKEKVKTFAHVKSEVLKKRNILAIDLSDTKGTKNEKKFKDYFLKTFAVYFPVELIVISHHKSELMFTTIEDMKHPHFTESDDIERIFTDHEEVNANANNVSIRSDRVPGTANLPIIKFNWRFFRQITELDDICRWIRGIPRNLLKFYKMPTHYLCSERAGIALTLEVSAFRSKNDDNLAENIVDNKFIRITSIGSAGGGGFHLNEKLSTIEDEHEWARETRLGITTIIGIRRKMSSMYASGYDIHIEAQGDNVFLKHSIPNNNVNKETAYSQESSQTIGVSAGLGVDKDGPSASLGIEASSTRSETISFTLQDFDMIRDAGEKYINYLYKRNAKNVPTTDSYENFNAAIDKINPIGYASFVPKFDVSFVAEPDETGTTTFNVTAAMEASMLFMNKQYIEHEGWAAFLSPAPYLTAAGEAKIFHKLFKVGKLMEVDWSHAVFTGYRPVYLQSAYFDQKTFDVRENGEIYMNAPDATELSQSFIYGSSGTYESVSKRGFCLDSSNLEQLQPCNSQKLTQRWYWKKDGNPDFQGVQRYFDFLDILSGSTTKTRLAVNKVEGEENGKLVMVDPNDANSDVEQRFYTGVMDVFQQDWLRD